MLGLETLLGSALGGAFRLGQAWLETREKQRDRDHEFRMTNLTGQLAAQADERRFRELGLQADMAADAQAAALLTAGIQAQATEAAAAGGRVAALSATVRPMVTYLFVALYAAWKVAQVTVAARSDGPVAALLGAFDESDRAILSCVLTFWFADRSMMRGRSRLAA